MVQIPPSETKVEIFQKFKVHSHENLTQKSQETCKR